MDIGIQGLHYTMEQDRPVKTEYHKNTGWGNLKSIFKRYGPQYYFDGFDRGSSAAKWGVDAMNLWFEHVRTEPVHLSSIPASAGYGADLERIRLEGLFKIIIGELPLEALEDIQAEWLKRGGQAYLEEARSILGEN